LALKRIVLLAVFVWLARWAAGEVASYAGRHWRRPGPSPLEWAPPEPATLAPSDE
jgi:hypothetical protein